MRIAFAFLLGTAVAFSTPAYAGGDLTAFPLSHDKCAVVGGITVGTNGRWARCNVTKSGWFATIDLLDLYQTQYCLGKKAKVCDQRALLLFANRAYTPEARLLLQRVDPGDTEYDAPLIVNTEQGVIMMLAMRRRNTADTRSYYLWKTDHWLQIDAQAWLLDLPQYLPKGATARTGSPPDIATMSAQATLYRAGDADCCPSGGVADINLMLSQGRLAVKSVKVRPNAE